MKVERICVLCPYPFPKGMAPSTRIVAYSKGLMQNSVETEVICFFPKVKEDENPSFGEVDGIKWRYVQSKDYSISKIRNLLFERPKVIWRTIKEVRASNKKKKIDFVLLSFDDPFLQLIMTLCLKLCSIKVAFIGDEYPKQIRQLKKKIPWGDVFVFKVAHRFLSCRILMTHNLIEYYNSTICKKPSYLLGSILDEKRFENTNKSFSGAPYLCYMGNMLLAKDNVDNIIEAFALIADKYREMYLYLYGTPTVEDKQIITDLIEDKHLSDRVLLMGRADYKEVPRILANAKILVTSQPDTKRAEGGFPTKMGEYMMSKVPMIVTDVGEIKNYVQDGVTTFMVPPCDPRAYADKIDYVLSNDDKGVEVAKRAYKFAMENFSSKSVTKGLVEFLSSI